MNWGGEDGDGRAETGTLVYLLFVLLSTKREGTETAKSTDEMGEMGKVFHEGVYGVFIFKEILFKEISRPLATLEAPG